MLKVIDLFCGCGGFSLGAHAAGHCVAAAFDNDAILTSSFSANFPSTSMTHATIRTLDGADIKRKLGARPDGVIGGPPCQAFSDIGRRKTNDPRRNLLRHFFRLVAELRPAFFVMENVRGLGYAEARPLLEQSLNLVLRRYEILGPLILDAADFGAATRRARLFIIGYDSEQCDPIFASDFEAKKTTPATVHAAISDLEQAEPIGEVAGYDTWRIVRAGRPSDYARRLRGSDGIFTGHRVTAHTEAVRKRFAALPPGEIDAIGRHPRLSWDGQCPNLRAGTGKDRGSYQSVRPIHPTKPRVITVREAARLQGFPDWFKFHPTIWHSFRMIGNSVSPIISQAILSLIAERMYVKTSFRTAAE